MALRESTILFNPLWTQKTLHIPGFVSIDRMEPVSDMGMVLLGIRYDDTALSTVTWVSFTAALTPPAPAPNSHELGTLIVGDIQRWFISYQTAPPATTPDRPRTLVVTGQLLGELDVVVPGFVSIDEMRCVDDAFGVELYITYNPTAPASVTAIRVLSGDLDPVDVHLVNGVHLGMQHSPRFGWRHVYYTTSPVPAASAS